MLVGYHMPEALPEYARLHIMHCVCRQLPCQVVQRCWLQCAGFYIIPRSPTEVYYDVSTEAVEAELYNWFYCCNTTSNPNCPTSAPTSLSGAESHCTVAPPLCTSVRRLLTRNHCQRC